MLAIILLVLGLSTPPTQEENDKIIAAHFEVMKLNYACNPNGGIYRAVKNRTVRTVQRHNPSSYTIRDVTNLDRGLRDGSVKIDPPVDVADCENLLLEAETDLDAIRP
jgi:hypothetical protein